MSVKHSIHFIIFLIFEVDSVMSVSNLETEYNEDVQAQGSADFNSFQKEDHSSHIIDTKLTKFIRRTVMDINNIQSIDEENKMNGESKKTKRDDQNKDDGPIGGILSPDGETQLVMGTFQAIIRPGTLNLPNTERLTGMLT